AGIRQYRRVNLLERVHLAIPLDSGAHLLRAWGDHKGHRRIHAVRMRLLCYVRGTTHVLVGGIGAAPDERRRDLIDKLILGVFHLGSELRDRTGAVWRVWPDDVRFQLREIDLDDAVKITAWIGFDLFVCHKELAVLVS